MKTVKITGTRSFASDSMGMPVSPEIAFAEQREPEQRGGDEPASEAAVRAYLAATGVPAVEHKQPETIADGWLAATGVPATGSQAVEAEKPAESTDPLGDAWLAATTAGFAS